MRMPEISDICSIWENKWKITEPNTTFPGITSIHFSIKIKKKPE